MSALAVAQHRAPSPSVQATLALDLAPVHQFPIPPGPRPGCDVVRVSDQHRAAAERWAHQFAQAAIEAVSGDRPVGQLARVTEPRLYEDLERRAQLVLRAGQRSAGTPRLRRLTARPAVQRVWVSFNEAHIAECAVTVRQGARLRAIALRFVYHRERWIATDMEFS